MRRIVSVGLAVFALGIVSMVASCDLSPFLRSHIEEAFQRANHLHLLAKDGCLGAAGPCLKLAHYEVYVRGVSTFQSVYPLEVYAVTDSGHRLLVFAGNAWVEDGPWQSDFPRRIREANAEYKKKGGLTDEEFSTFEEDRVRSEFDRDITHDEGKK
jgi:hypothetical protein